MTNHPSRSSERTQAFYLLWYSVGTLSGVAGLIAFFFGLAQGMSYLTTLGFTLVAVPFVAPLLYRGIQLRRPIALVLPVFAGYNIASALLANTATASLQLALIVGASIAFAVGVGITLPKVVAIDVSASAGPLRVRTRLLALVVAAGVLLSLASFATGGIPVLSSQVAEARLEAFSNGVEGTLITTSLTVAIIIGGVGVFNRRGKERLPWLLLLLLGFVVMYGFGNRGLYFIPLLTVLAYAVIQRPSRLPAILVLGAVLIAGISAAGFSRDLQAFGPTHLANLRATGLPEELLYLGPVVTYFTGTSTALDHIIRIFPNTVPHPNGATFFAAMLSPLPGNQPTPGQFLKDSLGLQFTGGGLATGAIGGFYMDFGILGLLIGMVLLGVLAKFAAAWSWKGPRALTVFSYLITHLWFMNYSHPLTYMTVLTIPLILFLVQKPDERAEEGGTYGRNVRALPSATNVR
ncbi:O-antigen polymerase [Microbacterium sp. ARD31]|uniref:O-antigen polymerase n=1 Tax=Microbacterium sp. ARD31 TaxID=2962576 RepID=UPI002882B305|nr:O-antigen polymerase [Microbacterium sp. ARD31]MDT0183229.1 O-antigen polymerase [Microbacterium sp. ARD31]